MPMKISIDKYKLEDISVAIVDDHEVVLEGYSSYLRKQGVGRVNTFSTAGALLNSMASARYDVFIVDVELPDLDVTSLITNIRSMQSDAKILISTIHEEMWVVNRMIESEVNGVMYKTSQLDQLMEAFLAVLDGQRYYCRKFRKSMDRLQLQKDILTKKRNRSSAVHCLRPFNKRDCPSTVYLRKYRRNSSAEYL